MEIQEKLLDKCLTNVKDQTFHMKRCFDNGKLIDGLKHATNMLNELRTSNLSPRAYYELYMTVSDELRHLELYLIEEYQTGTHAEDLYELVQYTGNILPRLYLLVTVGVVYIKCSKLSHREILCDLVEMCRGVQHPLRGLFLRNYLLQCMRGKLLPDTLPTEGDSGNITDSVYFILANFAEMNKLWVRMQHQGHSRDKEKKEHERRELRLLVGSNLNRLSSLESVTLEMYKHTILPQLLEQIISCRDAIAHEYLMDVIVHVFPDNFHLATLESLLQACVHLEPQVSISTIIIRLIDRLTAYAFRADEVDGDESKQLAIPEDIPLFDIFQTEINKIIASRSSTSAEDSIALRSALLTLAQKVYLEKPEYVNQILKGACHALDTVMANSGESTIKSNSNMARESLRLLKTLIEGYNGMEVLLSITQLPEFVKRLDVGARRQVAVHFLAHLLDSIATIPYRRLSGTEKVTQLFSLVDVLLLQQLTDSSDAVGQHGTSTTADELLEEQNLLVRAIHLFQSDDVNEQFNMLLVAGKILFEYSNQSIVMLLPALIMELLILSSRLCDISDKQLENFEVVSSTVEDGEDDEDGDMESSHMNKQCKIFKFLRRLLSKLCVADPQCAMKLFLEAALVANRILRGKSSINVDKDEGHEEGLAEESGDRLKLQQMHHQLETVAYEFVAEAFRIFEEEIRDSRMQFALIGLLISTVDQLKHFSDENFNPLRVNCNRAAVNLLRKTDQCRAVALAAELMRNESSKVIVQLDKCQRFTSDCMDAPVKLQLMVDILNYNIIFALRGVKDVDANRLNKIISSTKQLAKELVGSDEDRQILQYLSNTLHYIEYKQSEDNSCLSKDIQTK